VLKEIPVYEVCRSSMVSFLMVTPSRVAASGL